MLAATRRWVHALTLAGAALITTRGEEAFDVAMRALDAGSTETLVFQRPCHPIVEDTEAVVLGLWRLVRADRIAAARDAAATLIEPQAARAMVAAMVRAVAAHD